MLRRRRLWCVLWTLQSGHPAYVWGPYRTLEDAEAARWSFLTELGVEPHALTILPIGTARRP
jgi:isopentenyldiphosphate isomerase